MHCALCGQQREATVDTGTREDALLRALASGAHIASHPHLGPSKLHLAAFRRYGIARHLEGPAMGLPTEFPDAYTRSTKRGLTMVAFALWDELEWLVMECFDQYDGISD